MKVDLFPKLPKSSFKNSKDFILLKMLKIRNIKILSLSSSKNHPKTLNLSLSKMHLKILKYLPKNHKAH